MTRSYALALLGAGIAGSLTPTMHESEGLAQGFGVTYRRVDADVHRLTDDDLQDFLDWAKRFGLDGLNVTHPFKQAILPFLDDLDDEARAIGAVNTVTLAEGRAIGHNTDASGFLRALTTQVPEATGGPIVLLGAGGAGSAIAHALLRSGTPHLTIVDVDERRRRALALDLAAHYGASTVGESADPQDPLREASGLVHATPTGMRAHPGLPLDPELLESRLWVADIVYSPIDTELVLRAGANGCRVVDGGGMAVGQAVDSFELFTGRRADAARMESTFVAALREREES